MDCGTWNPAGKITRENVFAEETEKNGNNRWRLPNGLWLDEWEPHHLVFHPCVRGYTHLGLGRKRKKLLTIKKNLRDKKTRAIGWAGVILAA